jgi:hypothetical protein
LGAKTQIIACMSLAIVEQHKMGPGLTPFYIFLRTYIG